MKFVLEFPLVILMSSASSLSKFVYLLLPASFEFLMLYTKADLQQCLQDCMPVASRLQALILWFLYPISFTQVHTVSVQTANSQAMLIPTMLINLDSDCIYSNYIYTYIYISLTYNLNRIDIHAHCNLKWFSFWEDSQVTIISTLIVGNLGATQLHVM